MHPVNNQPTKKEIADRKAKIKDYLRREAAGEVPPLKDKALDTVMKAIGEEEMNLKEKKRIEELGPEVPKPDFLPESNLPEYETSIVGKKVKAIMRDPMGYMVAIDYFDIKAVKRISYNVIQNTLTLVLPETTGRIYETDIPVKNPQTGKATGAIRREVVGMITAFKTELQGTANISAFLDVWDSKARDSFEGFDEHDKAEEVLEKAMKLKKEEIEKEKNKSPILNATGEQIQK